MDKKTAALYSELFDGHIGTVLAAAQDEARTAQVEKALQLAKAAADRDSYAAACLLAAYEKDKAGAAALLTDFRAVAAAGPRQSPHRCRALPPSVPCVWPKLPSSVWAHR